MGWSLVPILSSEGGEGGRRREGRGERGGVGERGERGGEGGWKGEEGEEEEEEGGIFGWNFAGRVFEYEEGRRWEGGRE